MSGSVPSGGPAIVGSNGWYVRLNAVHTPDMVNQRILSQQLARRVFNSISERDESKAVAGKPPELPHETFVSTGEALFKAESLMDGSKLVRVGIPLDGEDGIGTVVKYRVDSDGNVNPESVYKAQIEPGQGFQDQNAEAHTEALLEARLGREGKLDGWLVAANDSMQNYLDHMGGSSIEVDSASSRTDVDGFYLSY